MLELILIAAVIAVFCVLIKTYEDRLVRAEQKQPAAFDDHVEEAIALTEAPVCGASDGELVCTLEPHGGTRHLDLKASSRWHSATFTT